MKGFIVYATFLLCSSCAMAPLTSTKNARPLGSGNWEINSGMIPAFTSTIGIGVTEAIDLGVTLEFSFEWKKALWSKYSFLGKDGPIAFALYGGAFDSLSGRGFFLGPVVDFKKDWFEIYLLPKYSYVDWQGTLGKKEKDDLIIRKLNNDSIGHTRYIQTILGINFWFTEGLGLNINIQSFKLIPVYIQKRLYSNTIPSGGLN